MKYVVLCVAIASFCCLSTACSGSSSSKRPRNTISEYDQEFDPEPEDRALPPNAPDPTALNPEMSELEEAIALYDSELYTSSRDMFREMQTQYPSSYYAPLFELKIADCSYALADYKTAIDGYEEFARLRPKNEAVPYVRLQVANAHFAQYRGVMHDQSPLHEALSRYEAVKKEFPDSIYLVVASTFIERCRKKIAAHEAYVANFYFKQGQETAGVKRVVALLEEYDSSTVAQLVNKKLIQLAAEQTAEESDNVQVAAQSGDSVLKDGVVEDSVVVDGVVVDSAAVDSAVEKQEKRATVNVEAAKPTQLAFARFRMASSSELKPEPAEADQEKQDEENVASSPVSPSILTEVRCQQSERKTIVTTVFSEKPEVQALNKQPRYELELLFSEATIQPLSLELLKQLEDCVGRNIQLQIEHVEASSILRISFELASDDQVRHLILDRPHRVVGLIAKP